MTGSMGTGNALHIYTLCKYYNAELPTSRPNEELNEDSNISPLHAYHSANTVACFRATDCFHVISLLSALMTRGSL